MRRAPRLLLVLSFLAPVACGGGDDDGDSGAIAFIEIRPGGLLLTPDRQSARLEAIALDADGNQVDATFTWSSSTPDQIAVDQDGNVSALSALGSATIRAEAGEVRSDPAVVATVALHPGSVVVTDDQVVEIGEPFTPDGAAPEEVAQMDVRLRGIDVPSPGTILVSSETSPIGGSVTSAEEEDGEVAVRLQLVSMPELFAAWDIDWQIGLSGHTVEIDEEEASARLLPAIRPEKKKLAEGKWPQSGPFQCSGSISAFLEKNIVNLKLAGDGEFIFQSSRFDESQPPGHLKVAIEGPITLKGSIALRAKAGLQAKGKCELKGRIPIALGPMAIIVSPAIPLGVGVSLDAKLTAASLEIGFEGENGFDLGVGFECGPGTMPCRSLDKMEPINKFKPLMEVPTGMKDMKVEMGAQAYFLTGLDLLFLAGKFTFEAVEVTVGPVQSAKLASVDKQMDDRGYASNYELKLEGKLAPGEGVDNAIKKLLGEDKELGKLGAEITISKPISKSPIGKMSVDKQETFPKSPVRFTVDLEANSLEYYLIGWNVKSILFYRKKVDEPMYELMKELEVSSSGTKFTWDWTPGTNDGGKWEVFALVKTALPVIELEIANDSSRMVEVGGICSGSSGLAAIPGGDSGCELTGSLSYTLVNETPTGTITTTSDASVTLEYDEAASGPGTLAFRPYGTWTATHGGTTSGCTVTVQPDPLSGTLSGDPAQGVFTVYLGDEPWRYDGGMATGPFTMTSTLTCEGSEPVTIEQQTDFPLWEVLGRRMFFVDERTHRAMGSYTDTVDSGGGFIQTKTFTWDLMLTIPEEQPPPMAHFRRASRVKAQ